MRDWNGTVINSSLEVFGYVRTFEADYVREGFKCAAYTMKVAGTEMKIGICEEVKPHLELYVNGELNMVTSSIGEILNQTLKYSVSLSSVEGDICEMLKGKLVGRDDRYGIPGFKVVGMRYKGKWAETVEVELENGEKFEMTFKMVKDGE